MKYANDILATLGLSLVWFGLWSWCPPVSYVVIGAVMFGCAVLPLIRGKQ